MSEYPIPEDLQDDYRRCCDPDDERYSALEATLIERIARLEAQNKALLEALALATVRSKSLSFAFETPAKYRGRNKGSEAYRCGYEAGFRGWKFDQPYRAPHHTFAYEDGFRAGEKDATEQARAAIAQAKEQETALKESEGE